MADRTPEFLRGFIVPMNITPHNVWNTESSYTEQNPSAGHPDAEQISSMTLLSRGNQSNNGDISIVTRRAGVAGYGSAYTWTDNTDSTTIEYGRDAFSMISGFRYIFENEGDALDPRYYFPSVVVDTADTLHVAYQKLEGSYFFVKHLKITKDGTETQKTIFTVKTADVVQTIHTAMVMLDDESLLLFHLYEQEKTIGDIQTHRSQDGGSSWSCVSRETLDETIAVSTIVSPSADTFQIKRLKAAHHNGVILLLIETFCNDSSLTKRNQLFQYVSIDKGSTFQRITTDTDLQSNSFHSIDCVVRNGRFCVQYLADKTTIHFIELPNASSSIHLLRSANQYAEVVAVGIFADNTDDFMQDGNAALMVEENGNLYSYFNDLTEYSMKIRFSATGVKWYWAGSGIASQYYSTVFSPRDSQCQFNGYSVIKWLGRGCMLSTLDVSNTYKSFSMVMVLLGGNANVNLPATAQSSPYSDVSRATFTTSWIAIERPSDISNMTASGSGNDAIYQKHLQILCDPSFSDKREFEFNDTNAFIVPSAAQYVQHGMIVRASFKVTSGGSANFDDPIGIICEMDNGTNRYEVRVTATTTHFYVWNHGTLLTTTAFDMTAGIDIIIAMSETNLATFYRSLSYDEKRKFSTGASTTSLHDTGTTTAENKVQFGQFNYTSGSHESNWLEVHVSTLEATGKQMSTGFDNPDDLNARPYPKQGQYTYVYDSVDISTKDGPTYEGEKWKIEAKKEYPLENIFHSIAPTPRIMWKSEAVNSGNVAEQTIAIKFDPDTTQLESDFMLNDLIGFHFNNINFISAELFYRHSGSWTSLGSISNRFRCSCTVAGRTARGNSLFDEPYFTLNELKDWTCYFLDGSDKHFRKIIYNTEGKFGGTATTTKQCTITVDTAPPQTSTVVYLIPPIISIICNMNGKKASGFKLVIAAQETYTKDFHIGNMHIGPVVIPGKQYQNRSFITERGSTTITTQDGIRYSREVKPPEKVLSIDWTEGVDISSLQGDEPDIDYWVSSNQTGAEPIAVHGEVPDLLSSFIKTLSGSVSPVVYLPVISKSTSSAGDFRLLQREKEHLFCTLDSDITIDHVLGNELQSESGEIFRVASMSFREIT